MDRRKFVKIGAAALSVVGLGSIASVGYQKREGVKWHLDNVKRYVIPVEDRIRSYFDYLGIDEEGLAEFARVHKSIFGSGFDARRDPMLYERFLLSTDFFQHGGDETRTVRYVSYYDPYRSPCWNPCASFGQVAAPSTS